MMRQPSLIQTVREAWRDHQGEARDALAWFHSYCPYGIPRVPGMDTVLRLAVRIYQGMTVREAAAREYAYRWHLHLNALINHTETRSRSRVPGVGPVIWPAPHLLGM